MRQYFLEVDSQRLIRQLNYNFIFWIFLSLLSAYSLVIISRSVPIHRIYDVWSTLLYIFIAIFCFLGLYYFFHFLFFRKEKELYLLLSFIPGLFLIGYYFVFNILGLLPVSLFFNPIFLLFVISIYYLIFLIKDLLLKYNSYLAKSIHFVEQGLFILILFLAIRSIFYLRELIFILKDFNLGN